MTKRQGDFARRGVHRLGKAGKILPLATPDLFKLRCDNCRKPGITVIAMGRHHELGWLNEFCWCSLPCAIDHGFRFPPGEPSRPTRSARAR
jgi:hypothetical protein